MTDPPDRARAERLRSRVQELSSRQHALERYLAGGLAVDHHGLMTMNILLSDGPTTPGELSRILSISPAAVSLVIHRLEAAGHVTRQTHPADRRKVVVSPSAASATAAMELISPLISGIANISAALDDRGHAAVEQFLDDLVKLYSSIAEATPSTPRL